MAVYYQSRREQNTSTIKHSTKQDYLVGYYNVRWYDAQLGRFISADTLVPNPGNPQSLNRLAYVLNNPLRFTDPTGHRECEGMGNCRPGSLQANYRPPKKTSPPKKNLPTKSTSVPIPRRAYEEQEIKYIALAVFAESSNGSMGREDQRRQAWVWLNRLYHGNAFTNIDNSNRNNTSAWDGLAVPFESRTNGKIEAINAAYDCFVATNGCSSHHDAFMNTLQIVEAAYAAYSNDDPDPTDGSTQFSHPNDLVRDGQVFQNGWEVYGWLVQNFYNYKQENPDFRYSIGEPGPYHGESGFVILVTGNRNCVAESSCGMD